MKVLILGANGYLGPHVVKALESHHELRVTDIRPPAEKTRHEFMHVDVSSIDQVRKAAQGMDAILNLSVLRPDRKLAFDVNTRGCYNMMLAAVEHKIRRVINTGPHLVVSGPPSDRFDFGITPDEPPQPGTHLYGLSKSLGQEICRVFAQHHDVYVQEYLFFSFSIWPNSRRARMRHRSRSRGATRASLPAGAWTSIWRSCLRDARFFSSSADMPHGKYSNEKAKRILGFRPKDDLSVLWRKPV